MNPALLIDASTTGSSSRRDLADDRQRRARRKRRQRHASRPRAEGPCLYCSSTTNAFTTFEHPFAESVVGENSKVLPKGAVCDRCNHGVNAQLDAALAQFSPIALLRVEFGVTGKAGKRAQAKFQNARLEAHGNYFEGIAYNDRVMRGREQRDYDLLLAGAQRATDKNTATIARAIFKGVLGLIYLDHGRAFALSQRFDPIRAIIRGERFKGFLIVPRRFWPRPESNIDYWLNTDARRPGIVIKADFFGMPILTDMEKRESDLAARARTDLGPLINVFEFDESRKPPPSKQPSLQGSG